MDGQQRTTFFYLLLKNLGYEDKFSISYEIREESNKFLSKSNIIEDREDNLDEEYQDVYFFKKTLRLIDNKLKNVANFNQATFMNYVLDNIKFLYIDIPQEKAVTVFTMMNGNKAEMRQEELIKAELLRLASLNVKDINDVDERNAVEWDSNMLRSRYAREWDKWLQWWNREDVSKLFKTSKTTMGLLITTYQQLKGKELSFVRFKNVFLEGQRSIDAKKTFDGLRRLQKRFEDAFNDAIKYNKIGAIIRVCTEKAEFIKWYFCGQRKNNQDTYALGNMPTDDELDRYYKWAFIGLSHTQIINKDEDDFNEKFEEVYKELEGDNLYNEKPDTAFRLLLRLNIDEDNNQEDGMGRKFDFSIWDNDSRGRSLEHIYPKSKVWHKIVENEKERIMDGNNNPISKEDLDNSWIGRETCKSVIDNVEVKASEHSIGNLVLLYKDDNSSFNNSSFEEKKICFSRCQKTKKVKTIFKSRHLLHTIYKFASQEWKGKEITENKHITLKEFKKYYGK